MANQRPSNNDVEETGKETRQGPLGKPVLMVLIGGLLLAILAWGGAELFGESTDNNATQSGQESPTTQTGTSGDTQANPPSSTSQ